MNTYNDLQKVLKREKTAEPVSFEFIIDDKFLRKYSGKYSDAEEGTEKYFKMIINGFRELGYGYASIPSWHTDTLKFLTAESHSKNTRSQNVEALISDEASFDAYPWPDAGIGNYDIYESLSSYLPDEMKLLVNSWGGILENATDIVGFENLCMMYMLQPDLTKRIFDNIGQALLEYYAIVSRFDTVAFCMVNDDWGFRSQTMFPPEMMREYIFPWTRKIVETIHQNGKLAILHSCGNLGDVMEDIIEDLKFDGKHSFEDQIIPVEDAFRLWGKRISVMGGIDVDFLCRESPENIKKRSRKLVELTSGEGGYALGSGNSIASYVPEENFMAMLSVIKE